MTIHSLVYIINYIFKILKLEVHIKKALFIFLFYVLFDVDSESEVLFWWSPIVFLVIKITYYIGRKIRNENIRTSDLRHN